MLVSSRTPFFKFAAIRNHQARSGMMVPERWLKAEPGADVHLSRNAYKTGHITILSYSCSVPGHVLVYWAGKRRNEILFILLAPSYPYLAMSIRFRDGANGQQLRFLRKYSDIVVMIQ
eukprot:scaffold3170_cov128-Cylindrotheca_fusiformis.AAC.15